MLDVSDPVDEVASLDGVSLEATDEAAEDVGAPLLPVDEPPCLPEQTGA